MENILFKEQQAFRQTWVWALMIGILLLFSWGAVQQIVIGIPWGSKPAPNIILLGSWLLIFLLILLLWFIRLESQLSTDRIRYRFYPFQRRFQEIAWEELDRAGVRTYSPIREYGGWGVRYGANGKAFNIAGDQGLQLVFKKRKKLLIGTQKAAELSDAMVYIYAEKIIQPL